MPAYKFELFGRLKKAEKPTERGIPLERVRNLSARGMPENDIIRVLRGEGFSFEQIDQALAQAVRIEIAGPAPSSFQELPPLPKEFAPTPTEEREAREEFLPPTSTEVPSAPILPEEELLPLEREAPASSVGLAETEAVVEEMIEERFSEVVNRFSAVDDRIKKVDERALTLNVQISDLNKQLREAQDALRLNIDGVNVKISDLEPRIASLEKAFKDIIPNLVDTVREVRELVSAKIERKKEE